MFTLSMLSPTTKYRISCHAIALLGVLLMSSKLNLDKFLRNCISAQEGIEPWVGQVCKNLLLHRLVSIIVVPIFMWARLLGGQFWAMGRLNLLGRQSNLRGG